MSMGTFKPGDIVRHMHDDETVMGYVADIRGDFPFNHGISYPGVDGLIWLRADELEMVDISALSSDKPADMDRDWHELARERNAELLRLEAENEALKAALKPFAKAARFLDGENDELPLLVQDDPIHVGKGYDEWLLVSHLRAAAEALNAAPAKGDS